MVPFNGTNQYLMGKALTPSPQTPKISANEILLGFDAETLNQDKTAKQVRELQSYEANTSTLVLFFMKVLAILGRPSEYTRLLKDVEAISKQVKRTDQELMLSVSLIRQELENPLAALVESEGESPEELALRVQDLFRVYEDSNLSAFLEVGLLLTERSIRAEELEACLELKILEAEISAALIQVGHQIKDGESEKTNRVVCDLTLGLDHSPSIGVEENSVACSVVSSKGKRPSQTKSSSKTDSKRKAKRTSAVRDSLRLGFASDPRYGGFSNGGNTCYLASLLHILHMNPAYKEAFDENKNPLIQREGESDRAFKKRKNFQKAIKKSFKLIEEGVPQPPEKINAIRQLMVSAEVMDKDEDKDVRYDQLDSQEVLVKILDAVDCRASELYSVEECVELLNIRADEDQRPMRADDSLRAEIEGQNRREDEFIFSLDRSSRGKTIGLDDLLVKHLCEEEREVSFYEEDATSGELLRKKATQVIRKKVQEAPEVLHINLRQYSSNHRSLSSSKAPVTIPEEWSIKLANGTHARYRLTGAIMQQGNRSGGHYTSYTYDPENPDHFYHFNDSRTRKIPKNQALKEMSTAYSVFYEKIEPDCEFGTDI